ncbi:hypothetical protein TELCIR_21240, partial [Teladorsagia circumcincta]
VKMREHVIEQLEEEIQAKQRLIYEQGHLIHILENENRVDESIECRVESVSIKSVQRDTMAITIYRRY